MHTHDTPASEAEQHRVALRLILCVGVETNIELDWSPPDIPDPCTGQKTVRRGAERHLVTREWTKRERQLKAAYGGILLGQEPRERLKDERPEDGAPLISFAEYALNLAWALYSRAVSQEKERGSFERYLRKVLLIEPRFDWPWLTAASQALRLSLGLPRFQPPPRLRPKSAKAGARKASSSKKGARYVK